MSDPRWIVAGVLALLGLYLAFGGWVAHQQASRSKAIAGEAAGYEARHIQATHDNARALELAAGLLALEAAARAGRGNAPGRGWGDAIQHLREAAAELKSSRISA